MSRVHLLKIGVSGIRGVVGEFLTPQSGVLRSRRLSARTSGRGGWWWGGTRASSGEMLQHAVTCGLLAAGAK